MKLSIILLSIIIFSCSRTEESPSDDYVLIEFASKLEEDYQKLEPKKTK
jgi:hypothetical protein